MDGHSAAGARPDWRSVLPADEREIFALAGYGAAGGIGTHPAILVIDVTYAFTGTRPMPLREAVTEYRTSCGENAWRVIPAIRRVLDHAHTSDTPVFYSVAWDRQRSADLGGWQATNSRAEEDLRPDPLRNRVVAEIAPGPQDTVVAKAMPSVFFGTDLERRLRERAVDTVICMGGSLSGCVRATVVDGFSLGFSMVVVEDACFDRSDLIWSVTMFDLNAKYAMAKSSQEVVRELAGR